MNKKIKTILISIAILAALYFAYRLMFIRVVNYEIGGIKIPSEYSMLTGRIKPLLNYTGRVELPTLEDNKSNRIGLSQEQVLMARVRWAVFEEWANSRPEYKGWRDNADIFKKANDDFKKELEKSGPKVKILQ